MKIFISWSGEESKQVALLLKAWLKKLLQATEPWMSDVDIEPGTRWSEKISAELRESQFGIICVTQENQGSEWINFEAGALSIALNETDRKVVPLLIGFEERGDLHRGPLGLFNAVRFAEEDMWKLILTMNAELSANLDGEDLRELFDVFWPKLADEVQKMQTLKEVPRPARKSQADMVSEILETVLDIQKKQSLEHRPPRSGSASPYVHILGENAAQHLQQSASAAKRAVLVDQLLERVGGEPLDLVMERARPEQRLTPREKEIARLAQAGLNNREIAGQMEISIRTVEGHIYQIFSKLGIQGRANLSDGFDFTDGGECPQD